MSVLVGRFLQIGALVLLPTGLLAGLVWGNVALETRLLFIGGAMFVLGWLLARKSGS